MSFWKSGDRQQFSPACVQHVDPRGLRSSYVDRKSDDFIGNRKIILSEMGWFYRKSDDSIGNQMILSRKSDFL